MRDVMTRWREWLAHCPPDMVTQGIVSELDAALSSSAGADLLEEVEGLRAELDVLRTACVQWQDTAESLADELASIRAHEGES